MLSVDTHPTEEEVLRYADGELGNRRAAQIRMHLSACWQCRTRMMEIEATIAELMRAQRQDAGSQLPPLEGARALLRAQLAELTSKHPVGSERWSIQISSTRLTAILVCAAVLTALVSGIYFFQRSFFMRQTIAARLERGVVPDPGLTPGATRAVAISEVCSMTHEEVVSEVSPSLRQQVFREYGIVDPRPDDYEIDYLIAPGLGGTADIHNLWPQRYKPKMWNASVKDSLEERLHQLVCTGELDLGTAQHDIATDWIAAYKKYFHTDRPLPLLVQPNSPSSPVVRS